jgi:hypothetical protein
MTNNEFMDMVRAFNAHCEKTLDRKEKEYAAGDGDRLVQFKTAAAMLGLSPIQALTGMMVKHTTSLYIMLRESPERHFPAEQWDEKIQDQVNYLHLLRALLKDLNDLADL